MRSLLSLIAISSLSLLLIFAGCGSPASTTSHSPSNTTPSPSNISFTVEPIQNDPEGKITIDNMAVSHRAGEPTCKVSGRISNGYEVDGWVTYSGKGFDSSGNTVSLTISSGPIQGWGRVYIAAFSSADFTLHLDWVDNLTRIAIYSQRTTPLIPSPFPVTPLPVIVNPTLNDYEGKIIFDNLSVVSGTLDSNQSYSPLHGIVKAGDPCWLVTGRISNGYDEDYWVAYHASGFDASGNQVSRTLEAGPIAGVDMVYIYGRSAEYITLHLNWADNVTNITLGGQMSSIMPP